MASKAPELSVKDLEKIMSTMWNPKIKDDPYEWVRYAFPWNVKGTPLEKHKGPRAWQKKELDRIRDHIKKNKDLVAIGLPPTVYKSATTSGRGIGKSSLVAWIVLWFESCVLGGTAIISANTDSQLSSKTFGEIGKWKTLCLSGSWFEMNQKKIMPAPWFADLLAKQLQIDAKYYYAEGVLWNEDNPDAFAGAHNDTGMLLIFDEASGIPQPIWTVSEGFFTEPTVYRFWFAFSNPRRNTGAFFECFHARREFWNTRKIDARDVEGVDQAVYREIIATHGEDSDEARIEVKGDFPAQGDKQFISRGVVADAVMRELENGDDHAALLLGCDPARYGDDSTVIRFRRGRDARSIPPVKLKGADNMMVANKIAHLIEQHNPDGVFIDAGAGSGIIDRLREMGYKVHEVNFGSASTEPQYADHRTELWARMREWLSGAMIDNDQDLKDDLCSPEYGFTGVEEKIKLEQKEKMKKRGLSSPDNADALAVTFHAKIARKDLTAARKNVGSSRNRAKGMDYKVFG